MSKLFSFECFKRILIIFSICTFLTFSYYSERANAIGIDTFVEISVGVVLSPEIVEALMIGSLVAGGLYLAYGYTTDIEDYIYNYIGQDKINKYFHIATDSDGNEYATIDNDGVDAVQNAARYLKTTDSKVVKSNAETTTNTSSKLGNIPFPYLDGGITFDMQPFYITGEIGQVVASYSVVASGSYMINWKTFSSSGAKSGNVTSYSNSNYLKFVTSKYDGDSSYVKVVPYSSRDSVTWTSYNGFITAINNYVHIGVYSNYGSVSTGLGSAVYDKGIEGNASDQVGAGNAVAVPISGQYDSTKDSTTYAPIDANATASVVSGLSVKSSTGIDEGSGTGSSDLSWLGTLWNWLEKIYNGIRSIPDAIEALPGEIATSFENALQYVFVPTATDFSDFYNYIEDDVKLKFPYSVSILNSLEVNADEFTDIHVTIWGHDCVIVSAQFVNNNISWIRVVTSCFWIFSLFVYVWRKINSVLNGGDVNSTTVYAPGGGSGPPSVI